MEGCLNDLCWSAAVFIELWVYILLLSMHGMAEEHQKFLEILYVS